MLREVKTSQRLPRLLAIKVVGATPAIAVGQFDATLVKNATGDYSLTLAKPFARVPVVVAVAETASSYCEVAAASASVVQILVKNPSTLAAKDATIHVHVMGFDAADEA
jgi:ABC-type cobalamin transport system permease subunit